MTISKHGRARRSAGALVAFFALAGGLIGCDGFLDATNPGAVEEWELEQENFLTVLTNGVLGQFQPAVNNLAHYTGVFTDELSSSHVFRENRSLDMRDVDANNGTAAGIYTRLQRSRFMADSVAGRIQVMLADSASRDLRLARSLAIAGYTYVLLGETMCSAPINVGPALTPDELQAIAIERFDDAIEVAEATRTYQLGLPQNNSTARLIAGADSVLNLARVGAARAALNQGAFDVATGYAGAVPDDFAYHIYFVANELDGSIDNIFWNVASNDAGAGSRSINLGFTPFEAMDGDPRVPRVMQTITNWTGEYPVPKTTRAYSNWSPDQPVDWARTVSMELASSLEAKYIVAEAGALSDAELLLFIDERRAVGNQDPIMAGTDLQAELRDQRARDFFLTGRRFGDLRRYQKLYGVDLWQHGEYPFTTTAEAYGEQYCLPLPQSELDGNPNL